jgi:hypothetical protein
MRYLLIALFVVGCAPQGQRVGDPCTIDTDCNGGVMHGWRCQADRCEFVPSDAGVGGDQ